MVSRFCIPGMLVFCVFSGCDSPGIKYSENAAKKEAESDAKFPFARFAALPKVFKRSVTATGGVEEWKKVRRIEGDLVLQLYGRWGRPYADRFFIKMLFDSGLVVRRVVAISASSRELRVDMDRRGNDHSSRYDENPELQLDIGKALFRYAHEFGGPWKLLTCKKVEQKGQRQILGKQYIKVEVSNGGYYFKPDTALLRFVTSGADMPGKEGLVTKYSYRNDKSGVMVPGVIEIVKIGRHILVSEEVVMRGQMSDMQLFDTLK